MSQFKTAATDETEAQFRQWLASLYAGEGVVSGLTVSQTATASGSVLVAAGVAIELGSTLEGARPLISNAQETLDVLGANPMGALPRNDIVVFDSATVAAGTGGLRVIVGTPNASPTDPAVPSTAIPLARLSHAASATTVPNSAITSLATQTSLAGVSTDPSWTSHPVAWRDGGGSGLSIGNGTIAAYYRTEGNTVTYRVLLVRGSTTNVGTTYYTFDLPFPAADIYQTGAALTVRGSEYPGIVRLIASNTAVVVGASGNTRVSNSYPGSWASGDYIQFTLVYEKA